jgi:hypothetical protein
MWVLFSITVLLGKNVLVGLFAKNGCRKLLQKKWVDHKKRPLLV